MKISQIRAIHRACHRRDLEAMREYLKAVGLYKKFTDSRYKTMRMYLRHVCGIECINGKLFDRGETYTYRWSPACGLWILEEDV